MKKKIGVMGGTGYVGAQLLSILSCHPKVEVTWITSEKYAGKSIADPLPHLGKRLFHRCDSISVLDELEHVDLVFSCLPAVYSMNFVGRLVNRGTKVIDLSPDFRLSNAGNYEAIYRVRHRYPDLLVKAIYGLTEINREKIQYSDFVANPGCFATSVLPALLPLLGSADISATGILIDIKTSLSGAGRAPRLEFHFPESNSNICIDSIMGHDQKSEIEHVSGDLMGRSVKTILTTSYVPVNRGIYTIMYIKLQDNEVDIDAISELYNDTYPTGGFIRILEPGDTAGVNNVSGSNFMDICPAIQDNYLIIVTVLDNLIKGAAGQAVQNMNLMFGFPENEGLEFTANYS